MSSICVKLSTYNEKKSVGEMVFLEIVFSVLPGKSTRMGNFQSLHNTAGTVTSRTQYQKRSSKNISNEDVFLHLI